MKYFVIFLIVISFFTASTAYGIWLPQSPEELLEESQVIFVGTITSVNELELEQPIHNDDFSPILDEYTITVEEFVKNPQDVYTITIRQPTESIPGRVFPFGGFEVGDRVLFYIKSFDGINTYSKESFLIPKQCDTSSVIHKPRIIGSDYTMVQYGVEKKDNFVANHPIQFTDKRDMGTLYGASSEYHVFISKQVGKIYNDVVLSQTITAGVQSCEWLSIAEWEFTPDAGNYMLNVRIYENENSFSIGNKFFSVFAESPLKQFKSGIPIDEIQCNDNLILIQKHNGSPACVKPNSVLDLIKRNWMTTEEIDGYAIDYDGDVKHLPFADVCSDEMKIILLTQSNIALPDEKFVMEDVELPFGMNQEDFDRCAQETSFTKSRWNMVTMENPEPSPEPEPENKELQEHYDIEIIGLKDKYKIGEKYSFYFIISGYGYSCANYDAKYPDENGNTIAMGAEVLCASQQHMTEFEINQAERKGTLGNIGIQTPGTYTVTVTFEKPNSYFPTSVSKTFEVIE